MKIYRYLWQQTAILAGAGLGFWLSTSTMQAGDPIVFVKEAPTGAQAPVRQVDKRVTTALDALETPSPLDGALTGPTPERPRQARDASRARRAELARKERESWMMADEKDLFEDEAEEALTEKDEFDGDERDERRPGLRQSASERRAEERETRVPMHLLSPMVRQKMQAEAMARRNQVNNDISEDTRSSTATDLAKMLTPSEEAKVNSALARGMRELGGSEGAAPRRTSENELGSAGGSELNLGPNITGPRLGPDLGESRFGASILDRSLDPERASAPSRGGGLPELPRAFPTFQNFRDDLRTTPPNALPNSVGPSARELHSLDEPSRPRRGGTLGR